MQKQQNLDNQYQLLTNTQRESIVNVRTNQEQSFQPNELYLQTRKVTKRSKTQVFGQNFKKSLKKNLIFQNNENLQKLPRVVTNNKTVNNLEIYKQIRQDKRRSKKSKSYNKLRKNNRLNEQISRDLIKHPMKYKIVQQLYNCKPQAIFHMKPAQIDLIQEENMKIKGLQYLRQSLERNKNQNKIKQQKITKINSKSASKLKNKEQIWQILKNQKQKAQLLVEKQQKKSSLVIRRVRKHMVEGQANFLAHLNSSESVDKAFISFLKTKIKRAEITCQL